MSITGYHLTDRILHKVANWLQSRGYYPALRDSQMTYNGLRSHVYHIVKHNPGLRCYEIENRLRINTPKQRVTNSILRDLEEDMLVVAINDTPKSPRRYYDGLSL